MEFIKWVNGEFIEDWWSIILIKELFFMVLMVLRKLVGFVCNFFVFKFKNFMVGIVDLFFLVNMIWKDKVDF